MSSSKFAAASLIALATLAAGSASAANPLPLAGEAPCVTEMAGASRAPMRAPAGQGALPAAGDLSQVAAPAVSEAQPTRAEVRAQTRQEIKRGMLPRSGEMS